jgi:hypothetical protein
MATKHYSIVNINQVEVPFLNMGTLISVLDFSGSQVILVMRNLELETTINKLCSICYFIALFGSLVNIFS